MFKIKILIIVYIIMGKLMEKINIDLHKYFLLKVNKK